jgi:PIN domain nuclease of toxin-antitoxin system
MSLLLDTHVFPWWLVDDLRLSQGCAYRHRRRIGDGFLLARPVRGRPEIKTALGRLGLDVDAVDLADEVAANGFSELAITGRYTRTPATLPPHHRDPFDGVLIAQAMVDDLRLVTADRIVGQYEVAVLST